MFFFFKQKTAYEIYQCDWSSDVCSSDLMCCAPDRPTRCSWAAYCCAIRTGRCGPPLSWAPKSSGPPSTPAPGCERPGTGFGADSLLRRARFHGRGSGGLAGHRHRSWRPPGRGRPPIPPVPGGWVVMAFSGGFGYTGISRRCRSRSFLVVSSGSLPQGPFTSLHGNPFAIV